MIHKISMTFNEFAPNKVKKTSFFLLSCSQNPDESLIHVTTALIYIQNDENAYFLFFGSVDALQALLFSKTVIVPHYRWTLYKTSCNPYTRRLWMTDAVCVKIC